VYTLYKITVTKEEKTKHVGKHWQTLRNAIFQLFKLKHILPYLSGIVCLVL